MNDTVFISNMAKSHDYTKAAEFGAIRPVTSGNYAIFKTTRLMEEIVDALAISTENDYLLFSGSSVIAALCMSVWMELHGRVKILLYDRSRQQYVERVLVKKDIRLDIERKIDEKSRVVR